MINLIIITLYCPIKETYQVRTRGPKVTEFISYMVLHKVTGLYFSTMITSSSFVHSLVDWLVGCLVGWLVHLFVRSFVRSFTRSLVDWLVSSFVHSFIRSFVHLLVG